MGSLELGFKHHSLLLRPLALLEKIVKVILED
jgi:hypothetical protein